MRRLLGQAVGEAREPKMPAVIRLGTRRNEAAFEMVELLAAKRKNAVALRQSASEGTEFRSAPF